MRTSTDTSEFRDAGAGRLAVHMFRGPSVTVGEERCHIPDSAERLIVWLALKRTPADRGVAAGVLWSAVDDHRAAGNLRSALWRLRGAGIDLIESRGSALALHPEVTVDAHRATDWAQRVIAGAHTADDLTIVPWFDDALTLLADWDEDWVILERERLRQRMLHAFEQLSRLLCRAGRLSEGIRAAKAVAAADPLRESAQRALIEAHLAADDYAESRRVLETYSTMHRRAFGVDPSPRIEAALNSRRPGPTPAPPSQSPPINPPRRSAQSRQLLW